MMETLEERTVFSTFTFWQFTRSTTISKYTGPTLNAMENDVPMEPIQLNAERLSISSNSNP